MVKIHWLECTKTNEGIYLNTDGSSSSVGKKDPMLISRPYVNISVVNRGRDEFITG